MKRMLATCAAAAALAAVAFGAAPAHADTPTAIAPGTAIWVGDDRTGESKVCTLGFIGRDLASNKAAAITAGHCAVGDGVGDRVITRDGRAELGHIVRVVSDPKGDDIALIRFDGKDAPTEVDTAVPVADGTSLPVLGVLTPELANATRPAICKTGITTGITCGAPVSGIPLVSGSLVSTESLSVDAGDSGSAMYVRAADGTGVYALGVLDTEGAAGTSLSKYAKLWGVDFRSPGQPTVQQASLPG